MTSFYGSVNGGQGGESIDTSTLLQKNDPTFNGTITGPNAHFTGAVQVPEPTEDNHAATKAYVDAAKAELQETITDQSESISTLNQQVSNMASGATELPYLKNTGDSGTGVYDFTGAIVNAAEPTNNSNVATKHYVDQKVASAGGSGEVASYTQGDGISISPDNIISLSIDGAGANGLKVGASGLGLDLATDTTSGAMAASDKTAIASNTTEITNIKDGTTELPYLKETNPTYEGTLIGGDATFTGSVQVSTPNKDNEAANKSYVDAAVAASNETIQQIQTSVDNIEDGTTELPYVKKSGDTMAGSLTIGTTTINEFGVIQSDKVVNNGVTGNGYGIDFSTTPKIYNVNTNDFVSLAVGEPTGENHAATKKYVDTQDAATLSSAKAYTDDAVADMASSETIQQIQQDITSITNGTTELPYISNDGGTVSGPIVFGGSPQEATELVNKAYVDANDSDAVNSAKEYTNAQIEIAKEYTDEAINKFYHAQVLAATSKDQVDNIFVSWWKTKWVDGVTTYNSMLEDWFKNVLYDDRVHGVKLPLWEISHSQQGEFTDDSIGLTCEISTEDYAGQDDFAYLPQFWCVEVAVEKNADYTHTIYACEFIDDINIVRAGGPNDGKHLVWVLQKNTYRREYEEDGYKYLKTRCTPAEGYTTWLQGTDNKGRVYPYVGIPKYVAGLESDGTIGSRAGLKPAIFESYDSGIQKWRARGSQYTGGSYLTLKWQLDMIALKYARKGNSNGIEGCINFNVQTPVLIAELNTNRVIINQNQINNFKVGQYINIGSGDRLVSETNVLITNIETVNISETNYLALSFEGNPIETTTDQKVCSLAWTADIITNLIQGNDGQGFKGSILTGLIQKTEFLNGAYLITSDEKWRWDAASDHEDGSRTLECYICEDASNITTGNSFENYTLAASINFPADYNSTNKYITDIVTTDKQIVFPKAVSDEAGSTTGYGDCMWIYFADNAMRAPWHCGHLQNGSNAGLAQLASNYGSSSCFWRSGVGAPGLAK